METAPQNKNAIDLKIFFKSISNKKYFIIYFFIAFTIIGLIYALLMQKKYQARCIVKPQSVSQPKISGEISGLASMAGIDISSITSSSGENIPSDMYPIILHNIDFQRELINTPITLTKLQPPTTLKDFCLSPKYRRFLWFKRLKNKTIGLPAIIARKRLKAAISENIKKTEKLTFVNLSEEEFGAISALDEIVTVNINKQNGSVSISVTMPEAVAAAQVATATESLLEKYIIELKTKKTKDMLNFVQERYFEAEKDYREKKEIYARYQDANRQLNTSVAQSRMAKIEEETELAFNVYKSLAQQVEQYRINVKEDIPVFMILNPVVLPMEPIGIGRFKMLLIFMLLGLIIPCGIIFLIPIIIDFTNSQRLSEWFDKKDSFFIKTKKKQS